MTYQLPSNIVAKVDLQPASGEHDAADEALRGATDALRSRRRSLMKLCEMVREADDDIAAGRVGYFDADATVRTAGL